MANLVRYALPKLGYEIGALAPVISKDIVDVHYNKHHLGYVNNLNAALDQLSEATVKGDLNKIVSLQPTIIFNGGSHINHSMYWENLAPADKIGGKMPEASSALAKKVKQDFGSFDSLMEYVTKRSTAIKGSGWGWLAVDKITKNLEFLETHDQDTVAMLSDKVPLLTLDVWEHAYYLDYKNARAAYLQKIWKIINWEVVEDRYKSTLI